LIKSLLLQALVFIAIFNGISWLRETSMLSTDSQLTEIHQVKTLSEQPIEIKADNKQTLVYFFAPWCHVCHVSIENLQSIYEKNNKVQIIAVALDYVDKAEVAKFTDQHRLTFPVALGNEELKKSFKVKGYPSYYVLDEQNTVVARSMGYSSEIGLYLRLL